MKPTKTHTPYIWLQENEVTGTADCGCELDNRGDDGPALYQCKTHEAAPVLLEAVKNAIDTMKWALEQKHPKIGTLDPCVMACQDLRDSLTELLTKSEA